VIWDCRPAIWELRFVIWASSARYRYLKKTCSQWYKIENQIGIYHLAGDFWCHLLYTIPKAPYVSLIILDGDKLEIAKKVVGGYSEFEFDKYRFNLSTLEDLQNAKLGKTTKNLTNICPIYCLQKNEIEDYLTPRPSSKDKCPQVAFKMQEVPKEIEQVFDIILKWMGINVSKNKDGK